MKTIIALFALTTLSAFAETYPLDTGSSQVLWKAGKKVGSFHNGNVKVKSGFLETDAKGNIKDLKVVVDMKTIYSEDLKDNPEYRQKLEGHLSNEDFFQVDKFPEAVFELTSIKPAAGKKGEYLAKGNLTIIGNTKEIEFPATIALDKSGFSGSAKLVIERLKWNLKYGSGSVFKSLTADKIINDTFDLTLNLKGKK